MVPPREAASAQRSWQLMRELVLDNDRRRQVSDELGLSFGRLKALRALLDGPLTMRELTERLQTDKPYTTLMVDDLERRELLVRSVDPSDRRVKIVTATEAGLALARRADALIDVPPAALLTLSADDLAALERILAAAEITR